MILLKLFTALKPDAVAHFAAESHVDRSIDNPNKFIFTNVNGTANMLNISAVKISSIRI